MHPPAARIPRGWRAPRGRACAASLLIPLLLAAAAADVPQHAVQHALLGRRPRAAAAAAALWLLALARAARLQPRLQRLPAWRGKSGSRVVGPASQERCGRTMIKPRTGPSCAVAPACGPPGAQQQHPGSPAHLTDCRALAASSLARAAASSAVSFLLLPAPAPASSKSSRLPSAGGQAIQSGGGQPGWGPAGCGWGLRGGSQKAAVAVALPAHPRW